MSWASLSPSAAAAVLANRAEIPIRIAPVTSFSSAQRPVSSSSSSQRESCFGSSVLPRVRSVVTTSVSVGGGGLLWLRGWESRLASRPLYPPPWAEGTERAEVGTKLDFAAFEILRGDCAACNSAPSPL